MRLSLSLPSLVLAAAVALLPAAAARADFLPADPIDGPSADLVGQPDVDLARDGSGAVAYLKLDGGVRHVFVSRFVGRRLPAAGARRRRARRRGRAAGGRRQRRRPPRRRLGQRRTGLRGDPLRAGAAAYNPLPAPGRLGLGPVGRHVDQRCGLRLVHRGGRVGGRRARRPDAVERHAADNAGRPARHRPGPDAGTGTGRSHVAISADGTGVVVWGEAGHVYARRVFGDRISAAPQDLNIPALQTRRGRRRGPARRRHRGRLQLRLGRLPPAVRGRAGARDRAPAGRLAVRGPGPGRRGGLPRHATTSPASTSRSAAAARASRARRRRRAAARRDRPRQRLQPGRPARPGQRADAADRGRASRRTTTPTSSRSSAARRRTRASRPSPMTSTPPSAPRRRPALRSRSPTRRSAPSTSTQASGSASTARATPARSSSRARATPSAWWPAASTARPARSGPTRRRSCASSRGRR